MSLSLSFILMGWGGFSFHVRVVASTPLMDVPDFSKKKKKETFLSTSSSVVPIRFLFLYLQFVNPYFQPTSLRISLKFYFSLFSRSDCIFYRFFFFLFFFLSLGSREILLLLCKFFDFFFYLFFFTSLIVFIYYIFYVNYFFFNSPFIDTDQMSLFIFNFE